MSYKQWNVVLTLASQVLIAGWLIWDAMVAPSAGAPVSAVAAKLLWAGLVMIIISIAAAIGAAIVGSIVTREEFKDERADERDKAIYARSMRNAYFVSSIAGLGALLLIAFGYDPVAAVYALFIGGMLAGAVGSVSQLVYYRIG
ncbi:MAG: hypothetical protein HY834_00020 [Devosia nanyangense]|uniref:DUF2178 domain-containing protein n=1 Tax=Devosia nanyangense TaxID=1228055 RepID=A0A933NX07_9HYPH|nr:hypothetical protein [Devosia nanyangense]